MNKLLILVFSFVFINTSNSQAKLFKGEKITYIASFGIIDAGKIEVWVDTLVHETNGNLCYLANIKAFTIGAVGLFANISNSYTTYIDTSSGYSYKFTRLQKENNYSLFEHTEFDREKNIAIVSRMKKDNSFDINTFKTPQNIQDIVSTYFDLRTLPIDTIKKNNSIFLSTFFEDTTIHLPITFLGKEKVKCSLGKLKTLVIAPQFPQKKSSVFKGEYPIKAWISDDEYKIPIKIQAQTKWGNVNLEVETYNLIKKKKPRFLFF
jgi:hypothetical protein